MKVLLDTHLLLWAAGQPKKLPAAARKMIANPRNELFFSAVSLWEIAIKRSFGRSDLRADPHLLRRGLLDNDYTELAITADHALAVDGLPSIHNDPFDRMLVAQATVEGFTLLTHDTAIGKYSGPIRLV
jgi:PIN domain nuclease of toxin-antitoxin system